jgi:DNA-binding MarR family transcriptional regulator
MSHRLQQELKQSKPFASTAQAVSVGLLRTSHLLRRYADQQMEDLGLTLQQYNVLRILKGANAPLPTMEIGERLVEPAPGITRMMSRIEKSGWATHQPGDDRRQKLWVLTPQGYHVLEKGDQVTQCLDRLISGVMSEDELSRFSSDLETLRSALL